MMLSDPDRHRRLIACALLFIAAFMYRAERHGWFDREDPETIRARAAEDRMTVTVPKPPASRPERGAAGTSPIPEELTAASLHRAHDAAASFAHEYLTWSPGEPHAERVARIASHSTRELTADIADARQFGPAEEADRAEERSRTAGILGTQTLTVRPRHVELTVLAQVTATGADASSVVPTNLTVALREENGVWLVEDLR